MLAEHGNISVGIDLGRDYSQIAFCSKSDRAPLMVMQSDICARTDSCRSATGIRIRSRLRVLRKKTSAWHMIQVSII